MASRIAGITIEIGGNTTKLQKALKGVNTSLKNTESSLKDVDKLLKFNPANTELLRQKQQLLNDQVTQTKDKLDSLKQAQAQMDASGVDKNSEAYMGLQREIIATQQNLKDAQTEANNFNVGLEKVKATANKVADATAKAAEKTRALSTAALGALTGMLGMAYKAATGADELNTLAKQTGFTTEELQEMQYAADLIDVSMDTITSASAKMTNKLRTDEEFFAKLGVATRDANDNFLNSNEIFWATIKRLSEFPNETQRDTLAMEIFGKSANELAGLIDDGGAAFKEYGQQAKDMGLILDQDTLNSLNAVNDTIDKIKAQGVATLAKAGASALEALTPLIDKVAESISKVLEWIGKLSPQQMKMILIILAVIAALSPLLSLISTISSAIAFLASPIGIAIIAIAALVAAGIWLYKNWDKVKAKAEELATAVREKFTELKETVSIKWEEIKTAITTAIETAKTSVVATVDGLKSTVNEKIGTLKDEITAKLEALKTSVSTIWETIKTSITNAIDTAKTSVTTAIDTLKTSAEEKFTAFQTLVSEKWEAIKNAITAPIEAAKQTIENVINSIKDVLSIELSFPKIKLPHFSWTWNDLGFLSVPNISVQWYKKAYDQPYMFTSPTVVGGRGFGDGNGGEMVYGRDNLLRDIKEAMTSAYGDQPIVVTVQSVLDGKIIGQSVSRYQRNTARAMGV